ncbi:hypothetical protein ABZ759_07755 [Streptomyces sp. NPDC047860]|uniref:hypothetical protein n=1 Tax=Streptomyces sp. NPDC047860 TaxID=3155743 RepID=UPI0033D568A9
MRKAREGGTFIPLGPGGALTLTDFANVVLGPGVEPVVAVLVVAGTATARVFNTHTGDEIQVMIDEARAADRDYLEPDFNNFLSQLADRADRPLNSCAGARRLHR